MLVLAALSAALAAAAPSYDVPAVEHSWDGAGVQEVAAWFEGGRVVVDSARPGAAVAATARYDDRVEAEGWAYLDVWTKEGAGDEESAFAAGYVEGNLTALRIFQNVVNSGANGTLPAKVQAFVRDNSAYVRQQAALHNGSDPLWYQVGLLYRQLDGLVAGYQARARELGLSQFSAEEVYVLTLGGDLETLMGVFGGVGGGAPGDGGKCSMLVKLTADLRDLWVSQATWSSLEGMLRTYKRYSFAYSLLPGSSQQVPITQIAFSSYPGVLNSGDDYYTLSGAGLGPFVQAETTIGFSNASLASFIKPQSIFEWARNMAANRLCRSGAEWAAVYSREQSGTYNNNNIVVDFSKFTPGTFPADGDGLLVILEQIPGHIVYRDESGLLARDGYFASYNVPYFPEIFALAGNWQLVHEYGPWFSYWDTARANIFRRDQGAVDGLKAMQRLMRYNDFQNDPLSAQGCEEGAGNIGRSAENAIACRDDLNIDTCKSNISALGLRDHVATDAKLTAFSLVDPNPQPPTKHPVSTYAQSGPTHDQQPPFVFSQSKFQAASHLGVPDKVQWPWVKIDFQ